MWPTAVNVLIVLECFTVLAAFNKGLKRSASGTAKYETGTTQRVALAGCQTQNSQAILPNQKPEERNFGKRQDNNNEMYNGTGSYK